MVALLTVFELIWLWFIIKRPEKWAAWVDKENDFWVRKGIFSVPFAKWMKRIEKGMPQKLLVGTGALLGICVLIFSGYMLLKHGLPKR